jgi:hypothetical protein
MKTTPSGHAVSFEVEGPAKPGSRPRNWLVSALKISTPKLDRSAKKYVSVGSSAQLMSNALSGFPGTGITAMSRTFSAEAGRGLRNTPRTNYTFRQGQRAPEGAIAESPIEVIHVLGFAAGLALGADSQHVAFASSNPLCWDQRREGPYAGGTFSFLCPETEKINAEYNNGVLEITPMAAAALPRRIEGAAVTLPRNMR